MTSNNSFVKTAACLALILALIAGTLACSTSTSTSGSSSSSDPIASRSYSDFMLQLLTYGQSASTFSVKSKAVSSKALTSSGSESSYCALITFYLGSSTSTIMGFNVYRSSDGGSSYTEIGTENYGSLTSTSSLGSAFYYYDYDATLSLGSTYYYKVQAFDSSGNLSGWSPVAGSTFISPFTVALTTPSNGAISTTTGAITSTSQKFIFTLSSASSSTLASLWSSSYSTYFYCSLYIKSKAGTPVYYGEFRYNFSTGYWQMPGGYSGDGEAIWSTASNLASGISYSSGTITVDLTNASIKANNDSYVGSGFSGFTSGVTYEWDVFGNWEGSGTGDLASYSAMNPAAFVKATSSTSGTGYGESFASTSLDGEGSTNGSFSFTY